MEELDITDALMRHYELVNGEWKCKHTTREAFLKMMDEVELESRIRNDRTRTTTT